MIKMPNDCYNGLTVKCGKTDEGKQLLAKFKTENDPRTCRPEFCEEVYETYMLSFYGVCPLPDQETDWYEWCWNNWGTKWDPYDCELDECDYELGYSFYTAWRPPLLWFEKAATKYPQLNFSLSYSEMGDDFEGKVEYQQGSCIFKDENSITERVAADLSRKLFSGDNDKIKEIASYRDIDKIEENLDSSKFIENAPLWIKEIYNSCEEEPTEMYIPSSIKIIHRKCLLDYQKRCHQEKVDAMVAVKMLVKANLISDNMESTIIDKLVEMQAF